jgi:D-arginine dehydrogenase
MDVMTTADQMCDALVIGGGIGGVSIAFELAADRTVCLAESESTLAFHTTGRSAATLIETYGNLQIRALTSSGRRDFVEPNECSKRRFRRPEEYCTSRLKVTLTEHSNSSTKCEHSLQAPNS